MKRLLGITVSVLCRVLFIIYRRHDALAFGLPASLGIFKKGLKFRFISVIVGANGFFVFPCRSFPKR